MAQQTANKHCINPSEGSNNSDNSGSISIVTGDNSSGRLRVRTDRGYGQGRDSRPPHSHNVYNVYEETIYGVDRALPLDRSPLQWKCPMQPTPVG